MGRCDRKPVQQRDHKTVVQQTVVVRAPFNDGCRVGVGGRKASKSWKNEKKSIAASVRRPPPLNAPPAGQPKRSNKKENEFIIISLLLMYVGKAYRYFCHASLLQRCRKYKCIVDSARITSVVALTCSQSFVGTPHTPWGCPPNRYDKKIRRACNCNSQFWHVLSVLRTCAQNCAHGFVQNFFLFIL